VEFGLKLEMSQGVIMFHTGTPSSACYMHWSHHPYTWGCGFGRCRSLQQDLSPWLQTSTTTHPYAA